METSFSNIYKNKKVLITGDTGFKGSWLSILLLELGAEVYGYALPAYTEKDNYVKCKLSNKYRHLDGDIRDREKFINYVNEVKPDFMFHLAAQAIVLSSYTNPIETFETNLMGTVNFFEAVRQSSSVKVAVNVTSDKCYDNKEWIWGYRENDAMGGKDPYSASKGGSEIITNSYLHSFFSNTGINIASGRAGNVIGGGDWTEYRIVPDFFKAYLSNEKLVIRHPNATRPWQFVLEPIFGYLSLGAALFEKGFEYSGGWNFGPQSNTHKTVSDLLSSLKNHDDFRSLVVEEIPNPLHEASYLKLDITKSSTHLAWKPVLNFEQTIDFTRSGYLDELMSPSNLYEKRVDQIKNYIKLGN